MEGAILIGGEGQESPMRAAGECATEINEKWNFPGILQD
jgi:hypothetical protein